MFNILARTASVGAMYRTPQYQLRSDLYTLQQPFAINLILYVASEHETHFLTESKLSLLSTVVFR